jgi:hypothetical protein
MTQQADLPERSLPTAVGGHRGGWMRTARGIGSERMLDERDISSLLDALNANRVLLARTRICVIRLQKNPRRYHGRSDVNPSRKIADIIISTPGLAQRVLEDPRLQVDGSIDIGVMKKSERLLMVRIVRNPFVDFCRSSKLFAVSVNSDVHSPDVNVTGARTSFHEHARKPPL